VSSQAEYWNEDGGLAWVDAQVQLDAQLAGVGALAVHAAAVRSHEVVLDVGCGCGATTAQLAALVGPSGRVVGVDLSAPMLARARDSVTEPHVEFVLGDAGSVPLPAQAFDVLYSRLGVMFFEDSVAAFAHLHAALKPDGRLSVVVWQSLAENEWVTVPANAVADLVELPPLGGPDEPGPFRFGDPGRLRSTLGAAGYVDIEVVGHRIGLPVGGGLPQEEAAWFTVDHGPLRRVLASASAAIRASAAERIAAALSPYVTPTGVQLSSAAWVATARVA
jgi:SAM-dependent methyltransferase